MESRFLACFEKKRAVHGCWKDGPRCFACLTLNAMWGQAPAVPVCAKVLSKACIAHCMQQMNEWITSIQPPGLMKMRLMHHQGAPGTSKQPMM